MRDQNRCVTLVKLFPRGFRLLVIRLVAANVPVANVPLANVPSTDISVALVMQTHEANAINKKTKGQTITCRKYTHT